ncbi:MAG: type II secretion system F family protein, partial [Lachnospiraceae bacterium]|nr:type II secretion system F family protein [Lachnospiraceae bacterium]
LVILVLIVKVLPIFRQVFVQLGTEMNSFATSLLSVGNTLSKYSLIITLFFFVIIGGFILFYKTGSGRMTVTRFLTRFPLTSNFYEKIAAGRFASGMFLALTSGMDTYRSLDMISEIVENDDMQQKIKICRDELKKENNLPDALASARIFSNLYSRMISVGFRSGSVDLVFKQIAKNYDEETEKQLNRIISIIEPTLVIILSLIVGMILLSVLLPLMGIMSSIG